MKKAKIEMRIEEEKKQQLTKIANKMGLKVSEILYLSIEDFLRDHQTIEGDINRNCKIVAHMMNINDLASQVEGELHDPLLKELGELECLL